MNSIISGLSSPYVTGAAFGVFSALVADRLVASCPGGSPRAAASVMYGCLNFLKEKGDAIDIYLSERIIPVIEGEEMKKAEDVKSFLALLKKDKYCIIDWSTRIIEHDYEDYSLENINTLFDRHDDLLKVKGKCTEQARIRIFDILYWIFLEIDVNPVSHLDLESFRDRLTRLYTMYTAEKAIESEIAKRVRYVIGALDLLSKKLPSEEPAQSAVSNSRSIFY